MLCCLRLVYSVLFFSLHVYNYTSTKNMRPLVHPYNILSSLFTVHNPSKLYRSVSCTEVSYHIKKCLGIYYCDIYMLLLPHYAVAQPIYNGNECTSVFGPANLTNVGGSSFIITTNSAIEAYFTALSAVSAVTPISQACLNYARIIQCLSVYSPCSGTAWCGSMSLTELTDAVNTACGCSGSTCPILASGQVGPRWPQS